ncbi:hypothetical protein EfmE1679_2329, partial [Enterococcus faecium E1679]
MYLFGNFTLSQSVLFLYSFFLTQRVKKKEEKKVDNIND